MSWIRIGIWVPVFAILMRLLSRLVSQLLQRAFQGTRIMCFRSLGRCFLLRLYEYCDEDVFRKEKRGPR